MGHEFEQDSACVARLREIQQEMLTLLDEAEGIVARHADVMTAARAKSYWIPHIKCALTKEHEYLDKSMCMDDTIEEMAKSDNDDDEEEYSRCDDSED